MVLQRQGLVRQTFVGQRTGLPMGLAYNQTRRAFPHGEAANRVRRGTEQP